MIYRYDKRCLYWRSPTWTPSLKHKGRVYGCAKTVLYHQVKLKCQNCVLMNTYRPMCFPGKKKTKLCKDTSKLKDHYASEILPILSNFIFYYKKNKTLNIWCNVTVVKLMLVCYINWLSFATIAPMAIALIIVN
jgi:hypothetical protein